MPQVEQDYTSGIRQQKCNSGHEMELTSKWEAGTSITATWYCSTCGEYKIKTTFDPIPMTTEGELIIYGKQNQ